MIDFGIARAAADATAITSTGRLGPRDVAVSPDGTRFYTADERTASVVGATTADTATVGLPSLGQVVTVYPDGAQVYVGAADGITVLDPAGALQGSIPIDGPFPGAAVTAPDGTRLYVADQAARSVVVIDTATRTVAATVALGFGSRALQVSPDGAELYAFGDGAETYSVIDTASSAVRLILPGPETLAADLRPAGDVAYLLGGSAISVVDPRSGRTYRTDPLPRDAVALPRAADVALSGDGRHLLVGGSGTQSFGSVLVIDIDGGATVASAELRGEVSTLALSPDGNRLYSTMTDRSSVAVLDVSAYA